MRRRKWILPLVIMTGITLIGCESNDVDENQKSNQTIMLAEEASLDEGYKQYKPIAIEFMTEDITEEGIYEWNVTTPKFTGFDNITALIGQIITDTGKEYEFIKTLKDGEERFNTYCFIVEPSIITNTSALLSLSLNMYDYTGGAHGNYWSYYFNYDLSTGEEITLDRIFKDDIDYLEVLYQYLFERVKDNEVFRNNLDIYYYKDKEPLQFYIEDGEIYIFFDVYGIGSYADGQQVFDIPIEVVNNYLSDYGKIIYNKDLYSKK